MDAEMDVHLAQTPEQQEGNVRNGHNAKTVLTDSGSMPLEVPRDRQGTFEPQLIEKYCRRLPGFDDKVIHLFSRGMSTRRIRAMVQELYGVDVSADLIARVTDAVLDEFTEWQHRPLADTYAIVYFGCDPCQGSRSGCGDHAGGVFSHWHRRVRAQGCVRPLAR